MTDTRFPLDKLLFRRQFILGPYFLERFKSWQKCIINDSIFLTVHPDLQVCQTNHEQKSLTLLGYILDSANPKSDNLDIVGTLIRQVETAKDVFAYTHALGGRWILIMDDGKDVLLFNDATGSRQVFYTNNPSVGMWCASQPAIMADELGLALDKDALDNFINTRAIQNRIEYWWPGESSPYKEISHLLPNHYLDLSSGTCRRFWPHEKVEYIPCEEAVKKGSLGLKRFIQAASNRFDLALAVTGGWDSRLLLAATREVRRDVFYYTLLYNRFYNLTETSPDVKTPSELLPQLGIQHHIIRCPSQMDHGFREIYDRNVTTAHEAWGNIAQGIYEHYPQNRVCIKAVVNEVARCYAPCRLAFFERPTAEKLARISGMDTNSFATRHFKKWLSQTRETAERQNVNIMDLFYLEQRMGNWYAMSQMEWDIAQEVFEPFNSRDFITLFLSVKDKYKRQPANRLYRMLIKELWPDVLNAPINPAPFRFKSLIKRWLMRTDLYQFVRSTHARLQNPKH